VYTILFVRQLRAEKTKLSLLRSLMGNLCIAKCNGVFFWPYMQMSS